MKSKKTTSADMGRNVSTGRFMGVKIAKPAVLPAKVSEATIRSAVRSVVEEQRRSPKT